MGVIKSIKSVFVIIGKVLLFVALFFISFIVLSNVVVSVLPVDINRELIQKLSFILQTISVILSILLIYAIFDRKKDLYIGWGQKNKFRLLIEGCIWGIACITTTFILLWALKGIRVTAISFDRNVLSSLSFPFILYMFVAVNEELLSRGYFYGLIKRDFGWRISIIASSIIFSILHISNPSILQSPFPLLNLFLAGILFGVAREVTDGLWVPIGIHFTWNFFLGNVYGLAVSGMDIGGSIIKTEVVGNQLITGGGFGPEGSIIATIVITMFTIAIWRWYRKKG